MSQKDGFLENSEAVRAHLEISQDVIQRMAANSSAGKAWCVTLVPAILVLVANQGKPKFALMAFREFFFASFFRGLNFSPAICANHFTRRPRIV